MLARQIGGYGLGLSIMLSLLIACQEQPVFEGELSFEQGWSYVDSVAFYYEIEDTTALYDLNLEVLHSDAYPYQNLYTKFVTVFPDQTSGEQVVSLELADKFGQWKGNCSGEDCTTHIPVQTKAKYPAPGRYGLVMYQHSRKENLSAINGFKLEVVKAVD